MNLNKLVVIVMLLALSLPPLIYANPQGTNIVISEVLYNPSGPEDKEWIELYNPTNNPINIGGWRIYSYSTVFPDATIPQGRVIQPHSYFLIGDNQLAWNNSWPAADYYEDLFLRNADSGIQLKDGSGAVIDALGWGNSNNIIAGFYETQAHATVSEGHSLQRIQSACISQDTNNNVIDFIDQYPVSPRNSLYACTTVSICGDGSIGPGEQCDDNNLLNGDGCSSTCQIEIIPRCGDNIINGNEVCDGTNLNSKTCQYFGYINPNTLTCNPNCLGFNTAGCHAVCGNGNSEPGEGCDDGNLVNGDGCSSTCQSEIVDDLQVNYIRGKMTIDGVIAPEGTPYKVEILSGENTIGVYNGAIDNENIPSFLKGNGLFDTRDQLIFTTGSTFRISSEYVCQGMYENQFTNGGNGDFNLINDRSPILNCIIPPYIHQPYSYPAEPTEIQEVSIFANVTDNQGVDKVLIEYTVNNGTANKQTMNPVNGLYSINLGIFNSGDIIRYNIMANDTYGTDMLTETFTITIRPADKDGDGYESNTDCNDANINIHPGAVEIKCDGIDQDCSGADNIGTDADNDSYKIDGGLCGAIDCDDNNSAAYPSAVEIKCDGIDQDCNSADDVGTDLDNDSYKTDGGFCGAIDCNDNNPAIYPGATEVKCDGIDQVCNQIDDIGTDFDNDSYKIDGGLCGNIDCNDNNNSIYPGAVEIKCDGIDQDCSGSDNIGTDSDNDSYKIDGGLCGVIDCNDNDDAVYPGAFETRCDGIDQDCSGADNIGIDFDNDTYKIDGGLCGDIDCNDNDSAIHPGVTEICNYVDDNCNQLIDENLTAIYYRDNDLDGYGNNNISQNVCTQPLDYVLDNTDCNDNNVSINPGMNESPEVNESCNGADDDCDFIIDEGFTNTDNDNMANCIDPDDDNDGIPDNQDDFPLDPNKWLFGDLNGDDKVNSSDLSLIISAHRAKQGETGWNEDYDLVKDGVIDIFDIVALISKMS